MNLFSFIKVEPAHEPGRALTPEAGAEIEAALALGLCRLKRKKLVNVYSERVVQVWLMWEANDAIELVPDDAVGELPEWYPSEVRDAGWASILDVTWCHSSPDVDGNDWNESWLRWGLHEGIAPRQPFLVELPSPYYSKVETQDGTEYDIEFYPRIIQVLHWPLTRIAKVWGWELEKELDDRLATVNYRQKLRYLQRTAVCSMYLERSWYYAERYIDEMSPPGGVRYQLCSTASLNGNKSLGQYPICTATLASGEDADGNQTQALDRLIANAVKELPGLSPETIKTLPVRSRPG